MEKIIENEVVFSGMMRKFSFPEIINFRKKSSAWDNAVKKHFASIKVMRSSSGFLGDIDVRKLNIPLKTSLEEFEYDLFSHYFNHYLANNELEDALSPFSNLEEFYFWGVYGREDLFKILEALQNSCPNLRKLMFKIKELSLDSSGYKLLNDNEADKNRLNNLLKKFKSLKTICLQGGLDRYSHYLPFNFTICHDFDNIENVTNFDMKTFTFQLDFGYFTNPSFTENIMFSTHMNMYFFDYKIEDGEENFQNFVSGLKYLRNQFEKNRVSIINFFSIFL